MISDVGVVKITSACEECCQGQGAIEQLVNERGTTPNQRLVELAGETLDRCE